VRIVSALLAILCLAGCNRGVQNKEAVGQGIADYLKSKNMAVDVEVTSVQFNGHQASAEVSISGKGAPGQKMNMSYKLEQRDGKWTVVGRNENGPPHGGGAMPGGAPGVENPHGSAMPMPEGPSPSGAKMPSPENLPPAGAKK
jgi:hypothetical protein